MSFGSCDKHACRLVTRECKDYPGKAEKVCPECEKETREKIMSAFLKANPYADKEGGDA